MSQSGVMVSFSTDFIEHVRLLYRLALDQMQSGKVEVYGINSYTHLAAPAYISSVAAVEAFLNEVAFRPSTKMLLKESSLWQVGQEWIERIDVRHKLLLVPQLLFDRTFERGEQPYQDFHLLVQVRNDFVHYKMKMKAPKYVKDLTQKAIALPEYPNGIEDIWVHRLSSSEGIRWAHNTACRTVQAFSSMIPEDDRPFLAGLSEAFVEIDQSFAVARQSRLKSGKDQ